MSTNIPPVQPTSTSSAPKSNAANASAGNTPASTAPQTTAGQSNATATLTQQATANQAAQQASQQQSTQQVSQQTQAPAQTTTTHQAQAQPQGQLPPQLTSQLQSGQSVRVTVLPPVPNQPTGQTLLQTPQGNVTVSGSNLPPVNVTATLSLASGATPTAGAPAGITVPSGGVTSTQQLWQLVWQQTTGAVQKTAQTAPIQQASATTPVTTSTLQGSQVNATTLSPSSVSHLLKQPSPTQQGQTQLQASPANPTTVTGLLNNNNLGPYAPNHNVQLKIIQILPPGQNPVASMNVASAAQTTTSLQNGFSPFQATVIASQPGQVIVQSGLGPMSFPLPQTLPPGSMITLLPMGEAVLNPSLQMNGGAALMQERWAGLKDAMAMLQAGNPQAAQQILQAIPQPNGQMASTMLFLLSTLRGGALENWVGKSTASRIPGPIGERLIDSIRQSSRQIRDTGGQEWRVFGMPVAQEGDLGELWLYLKDKQDEEEEAAAEGSDAKRFIIETNFQKMGPLQLDGMARPDHVDVMFRTMIPVEEDLRNEIREVFSNTITALGLTGSLNFHLVDHFPVSIKEEKTTLGSGVTI